MNRRLVTVAWLVAAIVGMPFTRGLNAQKPASNDVSAAAPTYAASIIGQPIGDLTAPIIINGPPKGTSLAAFRGKLLLLDFWSTTCSPCIGEMPHLIALQQQFADRLQILVVTPDAKDAVEAFFRQRPELRLPTAIGAETVYGALAERLGVQTLGTYAWVDSAGIVRAVTAGTDVTSDNVSAVLAGRPVQLRSVAAQPSAKPMNWDAPYMIGGNTGGVTEVEYHSILTRALPGGPAVEVLIPPATAADPRITPDKRRVFFLNSDIAGLFSGAIAAGRRYNIGRQGRWSDYPWSRTVMEGTDTLRLRSPTERYTYELIVPLGHRSTIYATMLAEIEYLFQLTGRLERRAIPVWVLVRRPGVPLFEGPKPEAKAMMFWAWDESPTELAEELEHQFYETPVGRPVVDETGSTAPVHVVWDNLPKKGFDEVRAILRTHGFELRDETRTIELLVIRPGASERRTP